MMRQGSPGAGVSRRDALRMAGLSGLALGLSACSPGFGGGDDGGDGKTVQLNMVWWGDVNRAQKTQAALDIFQRKNPGITVKTEYQDSQPYRDKLGTRFAAGDPPDVFAMRNDSLREFADRKAVLDLTQDGIVNLGGMPENVRKLGMVGDKVFGVPAGLNSQGYLVNQAMTEKFGVTIPDGNTWSWDDLADFAKQLTAASGRAVYGTAFETFNMSSIIPFAIQRGEDFFTPDGQLGVSEGAITAWLEMIEKMRAEGGFVPAGFIDPSVGTAPDKGYLAQGKIASQIAPTNSFLSHNAAVDGHKLVMLNMPGETSGKRRGFYMGCPHLWSVAAQSKHPKEALKLVDFLLNDADGAKATGTTRGVPASGTVADAIKSSVEPDDRVATDFIIAMQKQDLPAPPVFPPGGSKLNTIMQTLASEVEFKKKTPAQAAAEFITAGRKALAG